MRPRSPLRAALVAALALAPLVAAAQAPPPTAQTAPPPPATGVAPPPATPEAAPPAPIPLPDAAARAEDTARALREIASSLEPDPAIVQIEDALAGRLKASEDKAKESKAALDASPSLKTLNDLELDWTGDGNALRAWRKTLTDRATSLEAQLARLASLEATWQLTLDQARTEHAPTAVLERIRSVLADVRATQGQVQARRSIVLTLQDKVVQLGGRSDEMIDKVRAARRALHGRLFEADQVPIWRAFGEAESEASVASTMRDTLAHDVSILRDFAAASGIWIAATGCLFLVLLPISYALRSASRARRSEARAFGRSESVFDSPISIALLVTMLVAAFAATAPPRPVRVLFGFLLMLPPLFLLPRLLAPDVRRGVFALAGFYVVDRVRDFLEGVPLVERSIFGLEIAAALAGVLWLARSEQLRRLAVQQRHVLAFQLAWRCAALVLATSLLANAIGYLALSRLLGEGALAAGYLALVFSAGASIATLLIAAFVHSAFAQRLHLLGTRGAAIERGLTRLVVWIACGLWAFLVARLFQLLDPIVGWVGWALGTPIAIGATSFTLGALAGFGLTVAASVWVSRAVALVLEEEVFPRAHLQRGVPYAIATTARYAVLLFGFLLALGAAGLDWSKVSLLAGAFSVGIGFGLQNVVNNFVSGLILLYERPIQVGDTVQVGDLTGEVRHIGIRASTLRTAQGAEVIVPNGSLLSDRVVNWTLSDPQRRVDLAIAVSYGTEPQRVIALLLDVAKGHPDVLQDPPPLALFRRFAPSSIEFELRAYTARSQGFLQVQSDLAVAVYAALRNAGIEIPLPQHEVRVVSGGVKGAGDAKG